MHVTMAKIGTSSSPVTLTASSGTAELSLLFTAMSPHARLSGGLKSATFGWSSPNPKKLRPWSTVWVTGYRNHRLPLNHNHWFLVRCSCPRYSLAGARSGRSSPLADPGACCSACYFAEMLVEGLCYSVSYFVADLDQSGVPPIYKSLMEWT